MGTTSDMTAALRSAVLQGGPADGTRLTVSDRPAVLQVTFPCAVEDAAPGVRVEALHVYRLDSGGSGDGILRYGYDPASP
ncbi:hypothetical protein [Streptomyces sp. NPDC048659]|uniref:hypothetical protein n=1 Tax=Streptomyces sp. NPDC048659 TaxID=3155489 RepID=UPI003438D61B